MYGGARSREDPTAGDGPERNEGETATVEPRRHPGKLGSDPRPRVHGTALRHLWGGGPPPSGAWPSLRDRSLRSPSGTAPAHPPETSPPLRPVGAQGRSRRANASAYADLISSPSPPSRYSSLPGRPPFDRSSFDRGGQRPPRPLAERSRSRSRRWRRGLRAYRYSGECRPRGGTGSPNLRPEAPAVKSPARVRQRGWPPPHR